MLNQFRSDNYAPCHHNLFLEKNFEFFLMLIATRYGEIIYFTKQIKSEY